MPSVRLWDAASQKRTGETVARRASATPRSLRMGLQARVWPRQPCSSSQGEGTRRLYPFVHTHQSTSDPLEVRVIGDWFNVERDLSSGGIPRFSELSSINGRPTTEMLASAVPLLNNTLRHYKMVSLEEDLDFWLQAYFRQRSP